MNILADLITRGIVWIERGQEYVGRASDGVLVTLGSVGDEKQIIAYLTEHPTPDSW
jgi:hypothetical protein